MTERTYRGPRMGERPENRRQRLIKACWMSIWMLYLVPVVVHLVRGHHTALHEALGWTALVLFLASYGVLVARGTNLRLDSRWAASAMAVMVLTAIGSTLAVGADFASLFVYCGVCAGSALPGRRSRYAVPATAALLVVCGLLAGAAWDDVAVLLLPTLLAGYAMIGLQRLIATIGELREARETVARLAASEERLRLARDLHDLLGHSLSLITLKSELAGRLLPDRPEDAAGQVADIETVSRQALVDVREAVAGFRRATLATELAGARTALATARIDAEIGAGLQRLATDGDPRLAPEREGALAWALREAVTNVVRHSGATRCRLDADEELRESGAGLVLSVEDDGRGPSGAGELGSGLGGLEERLLLVDGALSAGRTGAAGGRTGRGFLLRAEVPLSPVREEAAG